jgi:hypothetical protein
MVTRRAVGIALIVSGLCTAVTCSIPTRDAVADGAGYCCVPAYATNPSPPNGATCTPNGIGGCTVVKCFGGAWQVAFPGVCNTKATKNCNGSGQTLVTIANGTYRCNAACDTCTWSANQPAQTQDVQVASCGGDGC